MSTTPHPLAACLVLATGLATNSFAQWETVGPAGFSAGETGGTSLAFSNSGEPYVAYEDHTIANGVTVMRFDGNDWVNVGDVASGTAFEPSLAFSNSGEAHLAYVEWGDGSAQAKVKKFDGTDWVPVGAAGVSAGAAARTCLAFSPSGEPYVAYQDWGNEGKATVMRFNGTNWVSAGTAGFSAGRAYGLSFTFSGDGVPYVAYSDDANDDRCTVMKFDGNNWMNVGTAGFSEYETQYTSIAINSNGEPYVAISGALVMKFDGSDWVHVGTSEWLSGEDYFVAFAINDSDEPYLAYNRFYWDDEDAAFEFIVAKFDGNDWATVGDPGFAAPYTQRGISLVFDSNGIPYLPYTDAENSWKATVMRFPGATGMEGHTAFPADISLHPNPAQAIVTIGGLPIGPTVTIMDMAGSTIHSAASRAGDRTIDTSRFVNGPYIVRIEHEGSVAHLKLVISR